MIPPEVMLLYVCVSASNLLDVLNGKTGKKWPTYVSIGVGVGLAVIIGIIIGKVVKRELDKIKKGNANISIPVKTSEVLSSRV